MYENYGWKYVLTALICVLWGAALVMNDPPIHLGLDLQGGDELIYQLKDPDDLARTISAQETDDTVQVLQERIDVLGIKELSIRRLGLDKIVVQVPGGTEQQIEKIEDQIERSGRLQFKILVTELAEQERNQWIQNVLEDKRLGNWKANARYDVAEVTDASLKHPKYSWADPKTGQWWALLNHAIAGKPQYVEGNLLESAETAMDNKGLRCVGFTWGPVGRKRFYKLTSDNVNKNLAVVLDGKLRSAPVIRSAIGKKGIIEMWDTKKTPLENNSEINSLIVILKAGALPAKPIKAYGKKVGAQLGAKAVKLGSLAIVAALGVVVIFMLIYYGSRAGLIADIALALNLFLILGTLSMFEATLTLPGIAGILLTAGMAVDANILIYERIREEIARGAKLRQAIQSGYDRAFWTIFDANLTTALTAVVLMWVGTGPIKGFGLTLTIGIVVSMFTALFVTRALYGFFVAKEIVTEVKFKQLFERPNIDFHGAKQEVAHDLGRLHPDRLAGVPGTRLGGLRNRLHRRHGDLYAPQDPHDRRRGGEARPGPLQGQGRERHLRGPAHGRGHRRHQEPRVADPHPPRRGHGRRAGRAQDGQRRLVAPPGRLRSGRPHAARRRGSGREQAARWREAR